MDDDPELPKQRIGGELMTEDSLSLLIQRSSNHFVWLSLHMRGNIDRHRHHACWHILLLSIEEGCFDGQRLCDVSILVIRRDQVDVQEWVVRQGIDLSCTVEYSFVANHFYLVAAARERGHIQLVYHVMRIN